MTCIRELSGSNFGRDTDCFQRGFCGSRVCQGHWSSVIEWTRALLWIVLRAARGKLTVSGTPNCPIYCDIFIVFTQFTNVADRIIQPVGPQVGGPWSR